jgi:hypothetical protein
MASTICRMTVSGVAAVGMGVSPSLIAPALDEPIVGSKSRSIFGYLGYEPSCCLHPWDAAHHHKGMERRLQMLGSALGFIAIGLMGLWEIVLRLH